VNLRDDDVLVGAGLAAPEDDLLLVSRQGQSVRFRADDDQLRPMGRATSGVTGMRFKGDDVLLAMSVVHAGEEPDVFVVFENGLAKRTPVTEYRVQGRGGTGIQVAKLSDKGGHLVGALTVTAEDEVMVVMERGKIVRSRVDEVRHTGRSTMGVKFATPDTGDAIVAVARNAESGVEDDNGVTSEGTDLSEESGEDGAEGAENSDRVVTTDSVEATDEQPGGSE
jgi:DNA gyrase subunit A